MTKSTCGRLRSMFISRSSTGRNVQRHGTNSSGAWRRPPSRWQAAVTSLRSHMVEGATFPRSTNPTHEDCTLMTEATPQAPFWLPSHGASRFQQRHFGGHTHVQIVAHTPASPLMLPKASEGGNVMVPNFKVRTWRL